MQLWDMDKNEILCSMKPQYGEGDITDKWDEYMYATLPPCIWGDGDSDSEGDDAVLDKMPFVGWNTTLKAICIQNSTDAHFGQMASWQMRGFFVNATDSNN